MKIRQAGLCALLIAMATFTWGCAKNGNESTEKQTQVQTQQETKIENVITNESNGEAVKDSSVFGENVLVFSPQDDSAQVKKQIDEVYEKQEKNQFGQERYAILFKPGIYDSSIDVNVGFYTQVAGLGILPTYTNINKLWVNADWMYHNATCNFWRSAENFSVNEYCMWANSQAVSLRRMNFNDGIVLSDGEGWSSGGFIADSYIKGTLSSGSQQQYLARNNYWRRWEGGVWNMVFVGNDKTMVPSGIWPYDPYTRVEKTPVISEKPFLVYDDEMGYGVVVSEQRKDSMSVSWQSGTKGKFVGLSEFYIANPKNDNADSINKALDEGKNILFTPGVYELNDVIKVKRENTILYGMGLATLVSKKGNECMEVDDVDGVKVCGLLFEAGNKKSETLLHIGNKDSKSNHASNPTVLSDVYFRVGGSKYAGKTKSCIVIDSNDVIGDNLWVWRADHGSNVGWNTNTAPNGAIINGDNVTMYGLFVEHFQEYQTMWNGNGGKLYFYQSEMPYDVPKQKIYMSHDKKVKGYASLKVNDNVTSFESYGVGCYSYNRDAKIDIESAVEVPDVTGVRLKNTLTVMLNGNPGILHVINQEGNAVTGSGATARVMEYENGKTEFETGNK